MIEIDIETKCVRPGCTDSACSHALISHWNEITVVGLAWRDGAGEIKTRVVRDLKELSPLLAGKQISAFNGKFDIKVLRHHGVPLEVDQYAEDPCLMATASYEKVSQDYQDWYARERIRRNKERAKGHAHREVGQHSLKIVAPFFLGVEPFWEPESHDSDEYVLKDVVYSLLVREKFTEMLKAQGTYEFYRNYLLPWSRMFLKAEERGVLLDFKRIDELEPRAKELAAGYQAQLDEVWAEGHAAYRQKQLAELKDAYTEKQVIALTKARLKQDITEEKRAKIGAKYAGLYEKAAMKIETKVNLGSPTQLRWLLKDHLGLDIRGLDGEEATDKEVLELLAGQGREDVALLLKWREQEKLTGTYFSAYRDLANPKTNTLHASFSLDVARTGRTSSSNPNLQNQPGELHEVFIARPGYKLITKDLAAIEPAVVAFYSEDPLLVDLIQRGDDFHGYNCNAILGEEWPLSTLKKEHPEERNLAKEVGLAVLYGAGKMRIYACATKRGFKFTMPQCRDAVRRLRDAWPDVTGFKAAVDELANEGQPIANIFGRKRVFAPDEVHMKAFNSVVQGTASDLLLESSRRAQERLNEMFIDGHFLGSIHDEVIFEVAERDAEIADRIITDCMTSWELPTAMGNVPLRVEGKISDRWEK